MLNASDSNATVGEVLRFNSNPDRQPRYGHITNPVWSYFMLTEVGDRHIDGSVSVTLDHSVDASYDGSYQAELGVFYSNATDTYGVSEACYGADPDMTLRIDHNATAEHLREKLQALSQIPSGDATLGGVLVTRTEIPAGNSRHFGRGSGEVEVIGFDYNITFVRNNGDLHYLYCEMDDANHPYETTNEEYDALEPPLGKQCSTNEWSDRQEVNGVFLDGTFTISLPFPNFQQAYDKSLPTPGGIMRNFTTSPVRFDATVDALTAAMEAVVDARNGDRVFGTVGVTRFPYVPSSDTKWSGQYYWVVTFLTRPGDVPPMLAGDARLFGTTATPTPPCRGALLPT